jgi:ATP-binding cassette subfamily B (MDR/TAP) protein 1
LSTIRNADRIAFIAKGKVREIGSHDELMAKPHGRYRKLVSMQNLDAQQDDERATETHHEKVVVKHEEEEKEKKQDEEEGKVSKEEEHNIARRARLLGYADMKCKFVSRLPFQSSHFLL